MTEPILPGYTNWIIIKQVLWLCSSVMCFIYGVIPNVGWAIIVYALFSHFLFLPFTIRNGIDRRKAELIQKRLKILKTEFDALPEEEREKEEVKEEYKNKEKEIKKKKGSTGLGCLIAILRLMVLIGATSAIGFMNYSNSACFVDPASGAYNFLGLDLLSTPSMDFLPSFIIPIFTTFILSFSGIMSTRKNLKEKKLLDAQKSEEEREEEKKLLEEMGIKERKFPTPYIVQIIFSLLYFYTFSRLKLAMTLYWAAYYALGLIINKAIGTLVKKFYKEF